MVEKGEEDQQGVVGVVGPVAWCVGGAVAVAMERGRWGQKGEGSGGVGRGCLGRGEEFSVETYCVAESRADEAACDTGLEGVVEEGGFAGEGEVEGWG
jgi:hypothetical protein